jgi:hypothetical protein
MFGHSPWPIPCYTEPAFSLRPCEDFPVKVPGACSVISALHVRTFRGTQAGAYDSRRKAIDDRGNARGDLFLGVTDKIIPVGDIGQEDREVHLDALIFPETGSYMVVGIANWDDGRQDVGYAPITREGNQSTPTFRMRIRRRQ